ncbi:MAG: hypothetical protein ACOCUL_02375 [Bacteroidota bacterium]
MKIMGNVTKFFFREIVSPRIFVMDKPGIVYNVLASKYSTNTAKKRVVFHFEDIEAHLEYAAEKKLGKKTASSLFYRYGKESGMRYMLTGGKKKIPSWKIPVLVDFIFSAYKMAGMSFAENVFYDNEIIQLKGWNNVGCRKTANPSYFAGVVAGIMTYLIGKNVEAFESCECPKCSIVAKPVSKAFHLVNENDLLPMTGYSKYNFPNEDLKTGFCSLTDLIKFKKIDFGEKHCFKYKNQVLIPIEAGMIELIFEHYKNAGLKEFAGQEIIRGAEILAEKINVGELKNLKNILSAFGYGIPEVKVKNKISVSLYNAPVCKYGFYYHAYIINGLLNYVYGKKFELLELSTIKSNTYITYG